jgi:hypothetical protein
MLSKRKTTLYDSNIRKDKIIVREIVPTTPGIGEGIYS